MPRLTNLLIISLVVLAASQAHAAKLVVMAVNSGLSSPPVAGSAPPALPAGAKGYLIGIANNTPQDVLAPLAIQDMTFTGVEQIRSPTAAHPPVQTKEIAISRDDVIDTGGMGTYFGKNDSWWWIDSEETADNGGLVPTSTGILGGLPGGPMTMTGSYNPTGNVPAGVHPMAYIVATGDVMISGELANLKLSFDFVDGTQIGFRGTQSQAILRFSDGQIVHVPEPGTFLLFVLGLIGFAAHAVRRPR